MAMGTGTHAAVPDTVLPAPSAKAAPSPAPLGRSLCAGATSNQERVSPPDPFLGWHISIK